MSLSSSEITNAAKQLREVYASGVPIAPLRQSFKMDMEDAYAVQEANTRHWLGEGRRLVGRKIGVTSKAVQRQLDVHQPDYGMLFADMAFSDGEDVPFDALYQPKIEGELAFVLGRDLTNPALTVADVMSAIEYGVAAIEIVDSRIAKWDISIFDTIADNASSGLYVLGTEPVGLDQFDHRLCGMVIENRGQPVSVGAGAACLGNPIHACLWLAKKMIEVERPLLAGDTILSGALGPLTPVNRAETYELRIEGAGSVRVRFA